MLYPKSRKALNNKDFENPTSEYRATPFWAWNTTLENDELLRQIEIMKQMGYGGFHMHVRTGLDTEYLSDEFMQFISLCTQKAKDMDMLAWLYDEDRWPSGYAGGYVTKDPQFRQRFLHITSKPLEAGSEQALRSCLLAVYDIVLDDDNCLVSYEMISAEDAVAGEKWYLYSSVRWLQPRYNDCTIVDPLNPKAIEKFIDVTHNAYYKTVGAEFSKTVPAIFTDEPQHYGKQALNTSKNAVDGFFPWTDALPEIYFDKYNDELIPQIPLLFWELPEDKAPFIRYRIHDLIAELFAQSYSDQYGEWCNEHNILFTGHLMNESSLHSQNESVSDAMRSYRAFSLPGIDMLCDHHEFITAKQAQSAVHQNGNEGMLSELDGVTNWDFDFRSHKHHGDWQAALGVTVRVPHLAWLSMNGEAKRDYPASINYQAAFCEKYHIIEDYFARVATAMTRGKPVCKVGVIHPIESFWINFGPNDKTGMLRRKMDEYLENFTNTLLTNSIDFEFICEANLPMQCDYDKITSKLNVGKMEYDVVIVPDCKTLRSTTLQRLKKFSENGGKVIFAGGLPTFADGQFNNESINFGQVVSKCPDEIVCLLEDHRVVEITENDHRCKAFMYQLRQEGSDMWLFLAHAQKALLDDTSSRKINIKLKGNYKVWLYDCLSGKTYKADYENIGGNTIVKADVYPFDSLLLRFTHCDANDQFIKPTDIKGAAIANKCGYTLCEPNVLLLDMASVSLDGGEFSKKEEILKLDNELRRKLGLKFRQNNIAQPWTKPNEPPQYTVTLRYTFESRIRVENVTLALENADISKIVFNGNSVSSQINGYFIDKCIKKVEIGNVEQGSNVIEITLPYGEKINLEAMYLLGEFGVYNNDGVYIDDLPKTLEFKDITKQGLLFYGGNLIYHIDASTDEKGMRIMLPKYRGALVSVSVDGEEKGNIICAPFMLDVKDIEKGEHKVDLMLYGTRINCLGQLHKVDRSPHTWWGADSWRTVGDDWTYDYLTWEQGILADPIIGL